jgi:manganese-dependent inorganic pyrophosphatase
MKKKIYVIGHRNPDTDSVVSAIVFSFFLKKKGVNAVPAVIGEINKETGLVLKLLKQKKPEKIKRQVKDNQYYLVDHGSLEQSLPGIKEKDILGVLDHHRMAGLSTDGPIFYRNEVVGSTSTLIFKIFNEERIKLTKIQASLLLSGIISDTLRLKSPTTTQEDRKAVVSLKKTSGINVDVLSQKMFQAKSDVSGMKTRDIILTDYKTMTFSGKKIGMGVYETVLPDSLSKIKKEIFKQLEKIKKENKLDYVFFGLIDIIKKECFLYLVSSEEKELAEKAFKGRYKEEGIFLMPGVVSRKKQIIPPLSSILN